MSIDHLLQTALEELIREARDLLPCQSDVEFLHYRSPSGLTFVGREEKGPPTLYQVHGTPLQMLRNGFDRDNIRTFEIIPPHQEAGPKQVCWQSIYGISYAPDGSFIQAVTYGDTYLDPWYHKDRTAYGVMEDGQFKQLCGTNWSGAKIYYSEWVATPTPIDLRPKWEHLGVFLNPDRKEYFNHPDFYVEVTSQGPDCDLSVVAGKLNEHFERAIVSVGRISPSYYNKDRWSFDSETCIWRFR